MAKSMTAYGRASLQLEDESWTLEISSINKKNLEMQLYLPKELLFLDPEMRKKISLRIARGQVTVRLWRLSNESSPTFPRRFIAQLQLQKKKWEEVATLLGYPGSQEISLSFLLEHLSDFEVFTDEKREEIAQKIAFPLFEQAFVSFEEMKKKEGNALADDIEKRLIALKEKLALIQVGCGEFPKKYGKKLYERLKGLTEIGEDLEERAAKELAILVEKMDVTEEIIRLESHLAQMKELLFAKEKAIGKTFDFLLQEAFREVNTLGNKVLDLTIIRITLEMKSELEKIREQIQNIE